MSILKSLFGKSKDSEIEQKKPTHLIVANEVFSHGWNDPSEVIECKTSILLDVVYDDLIIDKLDYWNKKYYDYITQHYSISEQQLEKISSIIGVEPDKYQELYAHWPKEISLDSYKNIFEVLNLKFVQAIPITLEIKGHYAIVLNEKFWNIPTHNSNVLVNIINTYERIFDNYELIHKTEQDALNYAIIIFDRLCVERPPETSYYYHEKIKTQLNNAEELPLFNYNFNLFKEEDKKNEYSRIILECNNDLMKMRLIISQIKEKPFKIVEI